MVTVADIKHANKLSFNNQFNNQFNNLFNNANVAFFGEIAVIGVSPGMARLHIAVTAAC